jgi:oxalate decarboxylase/phosphoglucose isomerase-like protein (cupin superfamily)
MDPRGNLTFLQYPDYLPFKIKRTFWTYDVPSGEIRGGHAYKSQEEIIFALSGSFDLVIVNPNHTKVVIHLNSPNIGVYLPSKTWRHMENFSTNSFALHLSNSEYNESDYLRDFNDFISCQ